MLIYEFYCQVWTILEKIENWTEIYIESRRLYTESQIFHQSICSHCKSKYRYASKDWDDCKSTKACWTSCGLERSDESFKSYDWVSSRVKRKLNIDASDEVTVAKQSRGRKIEKNHKKKNSLNTGRMQSLSISGSARSVSRTHTGNLINHLIDFWSIRSLAGVTRLFFFLLLAAKNEHLATKHSLPMPSNVIDEKKIRHSSS